MARSFLAAIRQQDRDWKEGNSYDDPVRRWAWPGGVLKPGDRWLQLDLWVNPSVIFEASVTRPVRVQPHPWDDTRWSLSLTVLGLQVVLSREHYE
jgi:hypothetical protein